MLKNAPREVARHADIKRTTFAAGENIDEILPGHPGGLWDPRVRGDDWN